MNVGCSLIMPSTVRFLQITRPKTACAINQNVNWRHSIWITLAFPEIFEASSSSFFSVPCCLSFNIAIAFSILSNLLWIALVDVANISCEKITFGKYSFYFSNVVTINVNGTLNFSQLSIWSLCKWWRSRVGIKTKRYNYSLFLQCW